MIPLRIFGLFLLLQCSGLHAQSRFYGSWHLCSLASETLDNKDVTTEEELVAEGLQWVMTFSKDGIFEQSANLNKAKRLDTSKGTWELEGEDALIVRIPNKTGNLSPIKYFYTMKGNQLELERYDPMNTHRLVLTLKKD